MFKKLLRKVVNLTKRVFKEVAKYMEERKNEILAIVEAVADVGKKGIDSGTQLILDARDRKVNKVFNIMNTFNDDKFRYNTGIVLLFLGAGLVVSTFKKKGDK